MKLKNRGYYNQRGSSKLERQFLKSHVCIALFSDGSGSILRGVEFKPFYWKFNAAKSEALIEFIESDFGENNLTAKLNLTILEGDSILTYEEHDKIMKLRKWVNTGKDIEEDPFHYKNNAWRIRAYQEETNEELRKKIINYFKYYKFLFKASIENNERKFSNFNSKGILRIYKGGIGLKKKEKISDEWVGLFYNKRQALEAYDIAKSMLKGKIKRKKVSSSWIKTNYEILSRIIEIEEQR